jgi:prepilin-type processing-associated H-X9-DG protein
MIISENHNNHQANVLFLDTNFFLDRFDSKPTSEILGRRGFRIAIEETKG